jgi:hypothetical protein
MRRSRPRLSSRRRSLIKPLSFCAMHRMQATTPTPTAEEAGLAWREPWALAGDNGEAAMELRRECPSRHVLYGVSVALVARRCDCDDVLFRLCDGSARYAAVHLSFAVEKDPRWPSTEVFNSLAEFATERLLPDIADWNDETPGA